MGMAKILLKGYRCERCGHEWVPRDKEHTPRVCPSCKSPYWDRPRQTEKIHSDVAKREGGQAS